MNRVERLRFEFRIMSSVTKLNDELKTLASVISESPNAVLIDRNSEIATIERMIDALAEHALADFAEPFKDVRLGGGK